MSLSKRIAALEAAAATGALRTRDLEVIATQVARAEDKLLRKIKDSGALLPTMRREFAAG